MISQGGKQMNDLTTTRLEEIAVGIEARARSATRQIIENGKLLCEARELLQADQDFGRWRERRLPWLSSETARLWMNVYRNDGEKLLQNNLAPTSVYLLTAPSTPESARDEANARAEAGEHLSVKATEEIVARHKAELEAVRAEGEKKVEAVQLELVDMKRRAEAAEARMNAPGELIRELALKRKGGGISESEAEAYARLPEHLQRNILETLRRAETARIDREQAQDAAAHAVDAQRRAMERAEKAEAERDEAKRRADEIAREGAQGVIDELRADVETLKKQMAREREEAFLNGRKAGLAQLDEDRSLELADLREKLEASEKETNRLRRELNSAGGKLDLARREADSAAARARDAEERLDGASPVGKDAIHAGAIAHMNEDLKATIAKLEADCDRHERRLSDAALRTLQETLDGYFAGQETLEVAYDPIWTTVEEAMRDEGQED